MKQLKLSFLLVLLMNLMGIQTSAFGANIKFADATVKALCVANWDTDKDGELSYDEAAAVTDLGEVFENNNSITSFDELQYFTGLTSIGDYAFDGCKALTSLIIPNSVTSIEPCAFFLCKALTSVTFPNSVTKIGNQAFKYSGLTSVTIPNSVVHIQDLAFNFCSGLTSITVDGGNAWYASEDGVLFDKAKTKLIQYPEANSRTTYVIPASVTSIERDAFHYCTSLTSVTIPNSVTSIGSDAFYGCRGLTSITIPGSVTSIGRAAFEACSGLTSVKVEAGNAKYDSRDGCNGIIETESNKLIVGCQNTIIPNSVTSIGEFAFRDCISLTSITIPNSVTSIEQAAFQRCI